MLGRRAEALVEDRSFQGNKKQNGGRKKGPRFYKVSTKACPIAVRCFPLRRDSWRDLHTFFGRMPSIHVSLCPNYPKHGCPGHAHFRPLQLIYRPIMEGWSNLLPRVSNRLPS